MMCLDTTQTTSLTKLPSQHSYAPHQHLKGGFSFRVGEGIASNTLALCPLFITILSP